MNGKLVVSTGFNRVLALNPATGEELWTDGPGVDFSQGYREMFTSRGVAGWQDTDARPLRLWEFTPDHKAGCDRLLSGVRYEGVFTPPALGGSLLYAGNVGGTNWGSMAYDRGARVAYLVINRWPTIVKLIPRAEFAAAKRRGTLNGARAEFGAQSGTPFGMARIELFYNHLPCLEGPWSTLAAVDLDRGEVLWERGVGTPPFVQADNPASNWGYQPTKGWAARHPRRRGLSRDDVRQHAACPPRRNRRGAVVTRVAGELARDADGVPPRRDGLHSRDRRRESRQEPSAGEREGAPLANKQRSRRLLSSPTA